jgi:tetratricopeptide (TPR) repeat protein
MPLLAARRSALAAVFIGGTLVGVPVPRLQPGALPLGPRALAAQTPEPGESDWQAGQAFALRGEADAALAAYGRALAIARTERDPGLASAARLGMAEVFAVWHRQRDSADVAYREAVQLAEPGDYAAADAYVRWLAQRGRTREARELLTRTYADVDVPRAIKRESIWFLLGEAAIQRAGGNPAAALSTLTRAREIAERLGRGDVEGAPVNGVSVASYWVLHDLAALRLDPQGGAARNATVGRALRDTTDAAAALDHGGVPRFTAARLADRVARARRLCGTGPCETPAPKGGAG